MRTWSIGVAVGALVLAGVVASAAALAGKGGEALAPAGPPLPAAGELVYVAGPDGDDVVCPNGERLRIRVGGGPPPGAPARPPAGGPAARPLLERAAPLVPRCGPGGTAVWVQAGE